MTKRLAKVNDIEGTIHVDSYLTTYSEAFMQDVTNFVAAVASSMIPVQKESNIYVKYPRGYFWRDEVEVRPLGGRPVQASYKVESGTYLAEEWALEHTIDDRQRTNADQPIRLDENATRLLTQKQMIRADRLWAAAFFVSGVWTNEVSGITDFLPFNDANSTPVATIDDHKEIVLQATGYEPNVIVMGHSVLKGLRSNPDILDRIKYTQRASITTDILAELFGVDRIVVARAVYNAAAEGNEDDFQFIVDPNAMLLAYIDPNPALDSPTAIARFNWTGLIPGQTNDMGGVMERGRDDRAHSDWFQSRQAFDLRQISADLGVFYTNATVPVSS
jgi:hypothetical protein